MSDANPSISSGNEVTLGCFEVGGRTIAIDVANVREVVRWQPVTPLPKSPALIEGVVDLRGTLVPVVDLGRALDESRVVPTTGTRIVVAETDGLVVGLMVDSAVEVLQVSATSMEDPPPLATHAGYDAARAVVRRPDSEPIVVLSLEALLEAVYRSVLTTHEDAA
ncbi:MAG: purine-binding chemotaxis protein CheW [Deltaproteobacteria bacterium]|jgi:purine-binding chemotaxis protein CheW|nr:purine-binding chemotaxis protein CheW [Deltaproteobacteria bacterium]MBW2543109.1 purine-binding chemotaxis protein CheW [Deltaproteobacteria bacterium]